MATRRIPVLPALGAAIALIAAPFVGASAASALPAPDPDLGILVFSKEGFTDPDEEDADISAELALIGSVTTFDGGDGSAAAWTAALADQDVVVFPEGLVYADGGTDVMSEEAVVVVKDWVSAGRTALGTGSYTHGDLVDVLTGVDYTDVWSNGRTGGEWSLQLDDATLPTTLPNANYAGGLLAYSTWSDAQKASVTPVYLSDDDNLGVASFSVGGGQFLYYAYDWFPAANEATNGVRAAWNEALRLGAGGRLTPAPTAPAPTSPVPAPSAAALSLELKIAAGQPVAGGKANFTAEGLKPGADFSLVLRSTPITLAAGAVPVDGAVSQEITIPAGLEAGWHSLTFASTFADGSVANSVLWFEIDASGALLQTSTTAPALAATGAAALPLGALALGLLVAGGVVVLLRRRATAGS
ncbi:hypothetical protein [Herbiconiux sp. L3-i23]|uniref:hypothetical protein n=1 Tax=Herbiconiux sp. L3-i23 TaxID=2905871 RepID=UPI00204FCB51|nr:hypothetical protein [Herbiconiux sp. L3-i23]BDI22058.1 hypothetical protein L3i23_08340 [Herbiconiux sp. L3-i23]